MKHLILYLVYHWCPIIHQFVYCHFHLWCTKLTGRDRQRLDNKQQYNQHQVHHNITWHWRVDKISHDIGQWKVMIANVCSRQTYENKNKTTYNYVEKKTLKHTSAIFHKTFRTVHCLSWTSSFLIVMNWRMLMCAGCHSL